MPYVLEIRIYQGPLAKPKHKTVRSKVVFKTKSEADAEVAGASRFWGSTRVVKVPVGFDPVKWNREWVENHRGKK